MITAFINFNFDLHYHEKIGQGRTPAETKEILVEIHKYIANTLHDKLTPAEIGKIDLSKLSSAALVSSMNDIIELFRKDPGMERYIKWDIS